MTVNHSPESHFGPPPRWRRIGLIVAILAGICLITTAVTVTIAISRHDWTPAGQRAASAATTAPATPAAPATSSAPSPTPTPAAAPPPLDERAACVQLVPVLSDAADIVIALGKHPDGSTIDRVALDRTMTTLNGIAQREPTSLQSDTRIQVGALQDIQTIFRTGANRTLDFSDFKASGIRLATRCRPYATG
jgi:hypothetical protein